MAPQIVVVVLFFFFQAEDGIRDHCVTGVQTCALPISNTPSRKPCEVLATATLVNVNLMAVANTSQGLRLGVFDFADSSLSPKWATADLSSSRGLGTGGQGYGLFQNMGLTFNNSSPIDIRKRTAGSDSGLLSTAGDFTSLATGPG